jgi:hypothetical protein
MLSEFAVVQFQRVNRAGLDPKRRKDVIAAERPLAFSASACPATVLRRERPLVFEPSAKLSRRNLRLVITPRPG